MQARIVMLRAAVWAGAVVCAAIATVYVLGMWWTGWWCVTTDVRVDVGLGAVEVRVPANNQKRISVEGRVLVQRHSTSGWIWWPSWRKRGAATSVVAPLWMPLVLAAAPTAWAWRRERVLTKRGREGRCLACGYDRAGIVPPAVCPECGASP